MKRCELCKSMARVYCASDRAILCWSCDAEVHSANFLVARHSRSLLCQLCHSPTPWSASGEKLLPSTASICVRCVVESISDDDDDDDRGERVGGDDGVEIELEDSVDENDNQVMPWSSSPPPPASSSSTGKDLFTVDGSASLKRKRQNVADLTSEDCSSVNKNHHTPSSPSSPSTQSSSVAIVDMKKKIRCQEKIISGEYKSSAVVGRCKSTRIAD